jgi:hypothetical protein
MRLADALRPAERPLCPLERGTRAVESGVVPVDGLADAVEGTLLFACRLLGLRSCSVALGHAGLDLSDLHAKLSRAALVARCALPVECLQQGSLLAHLARLAVEGSGLLLAGRDALGDAETKAPDFFDVALLALSGLRSFDARLALEFFELLTRRVCSGSARGGGTAKRPGGLLESPLLTRMSLDELLEIGDLLAQRGRRAGGGFVRPLLRLGDVIQGPDDLLRDLRHRVPRAQDYLDEIALLVYDVASISF